MVSNLKARATEYKGVVYRSKCEAMFARYLELSITETYQQYCKQIPDSLALGRSFFGFLYEPEGFDVDGWRPDFVCYWSLFPNKSFHLPTTIYEVIEYKPTKPTDTYLREFATRCESLEKLLQKMIGKVSCMVKYHLYWGSVFSDDGGVVEARSGNWTQYDCLTWLEPRYIDAIRSTRFDLEHSDAQD